MKERDEMRVDDYREMKRNLNEDEGEGKEDGIERIQ